MRHGLSRSSVSSLGLSMLACQTHLITKPAGYDQGVLGGLIALPTFLSANRINPDDSDLQGTIVAIYDIGCLTGCIIMGFVGQKLGRRMFIVIGGVLLFVGAGLQAGANGVSYLISGRVVGGIGMGMVTTMVPIWVSETAKANQRGALVAAQLAIVIFGVTVAYWFDFGMIKQHPNTTAVWRVPIAFQVFFIILTWITIFFLPESPRYLYAQGYHDDADNITARLHDTTVDSDEVQNHRKEVFAILEAEKELKFTFKHLFKDGSKVNVTWRLWLGVLVQFLQQMDGNNIVSYVSTLGLAIMYIWEYELTRRCRPVRDLPLHQLTWNVSESGSPHLWWCHTGLFRRFLYAHLHRRKIWPAHYDAVGCYLLLTLDDSLHHRPSCEH